MEIQQPAVSKTSGGFYTASMFTNPDYQYRAAGVVISHDHILLCHAPKDQYWYLPGTCMRLRDQAAGALERELHRQTGLKPKIGRLIWAVNGYFQVDEGIQHEVGLYHLVNFERESAIYRLDVPFYGFEGANPGKQLVFQWFPRQASLLESLPLQPKFLARAVEKLPITPEYIVYRDSAAVTI